MGLAPSATLLMSKKDSTLLKSVREASISLKSEQEKQKQLECLASTSDWRGWVSRERT